MWFQERVKALERNQEKATDSDILQIQLNTLNATLNEKLSEIDQLQRENSMKLNQLENVKKEVNYLNLLFFSSAWHTWMISSYNMS